MKQLPDSGERTAFTTGAVRDASLGKGIPSMIPPTAIRRMGKRFEDGASKYGAGNWMKGIPLSRYQDAIMRHTLAAAEGQTDEDHIGAILWNSAAWAWTEEAIASGELPKELDDLLFKGGKEASESIDYKMKLVKLMASDEDRAWMLNLIRDAGVSDFFAKILCEKFEDPSFSKKEFISLLLSGKVRCASNGVINLLGEDGQVIQCWPSHSLFMQFLCMSDDPSHIDYLIAEAKKSGALSNSDASKIISARGNNPHPKP